MADTFGPVYEKSISHGLNVPGLSIPPPGVAALLILVFALKVDGWRKLFVSHASNNIQSLAVIPLRNLSGDSSQDYCAEGVTDTLITDLAQIKSIRVISSTSSMQYKATKKTMPEIGRELSVDAVVEESIVRDGSRVRFRSIDPGKHGPPSLG